MERFIPTEKSLDLSQSLAESMNMDFNREEVKILAKNLHPLYFSEILAKLSLNSKDLNFIQGSERKINAFVEPNTQQSTNIHFDEQFDFWLMNLCFLNAIATFKVLNGNQAKNLDILFASTLDSFSNTYMHESLRELFKPLLFEHQECLKFGHDLSKSMIAFIICHEIAHVLLGHHLKKEEVLQDEYDADWKAFELYTELLKHPDKSGYLSMGSEFLTAPIILFNYFSVVEKYKFLKTKKAPSRRTHPNPISRAKKVSSQYEKDSNDKATYILEGFFNGLADLISPLDLPKKL